MRKRRRNENYRLDDFVVPDEPLEILDDDIKQKDKVTNNKFTKSKVLRYCELGNYLYDTRHCWYRYQSKYHTCLLGNCHVFENVVHDSQLIQWKPPIDIWLLILQFVFVPSSRDDAYTSDDRKRFMYLLTHLTNLYGDHNFWRRLDIHSPIITYFMTWDFSHSDHQTKYESLVSSTATTARTSESFCHSCFTCLGANNKTHYLAYYPWTLPNQQLRTDRIFCNACMFYLIPKVKQSQLYEHYALSLYAMKRHGYKPIYDRQAGQEKDSTIQIGCEESLWALKDVLIVQQLETERKNQKQEERLLRKQRRQAFLKKTKT